MHNWFTIYNPITKEGCRFYVVGSAVDGFIEEDSDIIRTFFYKNAGYEMIVSDTDELIDRIYNEGGTIINSSNISKEAREIYIKASYKHG